MKYNSWGIYNPGIVILHGDDTTKLPVLFATIDNAKKTGLPICIASPKAIKNKVVDGSVTKYGGQELNRIERVIKAGFEIKSDPVVILKSCCPLVEDTLIKRCLNMYKRRGVEYISTTQYKEDEFVDTPTSKFPKGLDLEIVSYRLLIKAYNNATSDIDRYYINSWIVRNYGFHLFNQGTVTLDKSKNYIVKGPNKLKRLKELEKPYWKRDS